MARYVWAPAEVTDAKVISVLSRTVSAPPGSPDPRDTYLVPVGATGAWSGFVGQVTGWDTVAWAAGTPMAGAIVNVVDAPVTLVADGTTTVADWMRCVDNTDSRLEHRFNAKDLGFAGPDGAVGVAAPLATDSNDARISVRLFDKTVEESVDMECPIVLGATKLKLTLDARAEVGPPAARTAGLKLYWCRISGAVGLWSAGLVLDDFDFPTTVEDFQPWTQTITLAALGMTAGDIVKMELSRIAPTAGTNLDSDMALLYVRTRFI